MKKTTVANIKSTALLKTQSEEKGLSHLLAISESLKKIMSTNKRALLRGMGAGIMIREAVLI